MDVQAYPLHGGGGGGGKAWIAIKAKFFEIAIEEKGKKLEGCIWERCKGVTSWIKFGDSSLRHLLLSLEDCENIACNQEWFTKWEETGRSYKLERRMNNAGSFIRCTGRDMGAKWFCLCFPEGKGLLKGWKLLSKKLRSLGVGPKEGTVKKIAEKMVPLIRLKKKSSPEIISFAEAVMGKEHGVSIEAIRVTVGEEETAERLRKLSCCLVGWWGGGTLSMQELKIIKRRVWYTWEVRGNLNVVEMGKGLWLFEFNNTKEAERILRVGTRNLGVFFLYFSRNGPKKMDAK